VPRSKLRRLYESEAQGLLDEALLDEVGLLLHLRCQSILQAEEARRGRVRCPQCEHVILRPERRHEDEVLHCQGCGWEMRWQEYAKSFRRRQLNVGGAKRVFELYVQQYPRADSPQDRMLLIDQLIHAFHVYVFAWSQGPQPTRPVCPNLIDGKLDELLPFLDSLAYGEGSPPARRATQQAWRQGLRDTERFFEYMQNRPDRRRRDRGRRWEGD
jgi:predicted RNA-binding Zn-ribbon protein involved in translation (DUF1610 family)